MTIARLLAKVPIVPEPRTTRIIKRYSNRKLYDTSQSCYVTLEEISELVRGGEDVRIIDNTSKDDITRVVLAQIVLEAEKRKKRSLSLDTLRHLIQTGGELLEKTISPVREESARRVSAAKAAISRAEDDARDRVTHIVGSTQKAFEDFQRRVDDHLKATMGTLAQMRSPGGDLAVIGDRLDAIEARLAALEARGRTTDETQSSTEEEMS